MDFQASHLVMIGHFFFVIFLVSFCVVGFVVFFCEKGCKGIFSDLDLGWCGVCVFSSWLSFSGVVFDLSLFFLSH